jgi:hypothetical protein
LDGAATEGAGKMLAKPAIDVLTLMKSRIASDENSANSTATAAAAQTAARMRAEIDALRPPCAGGTYSLGSGSPSRSEM